MEENKTNTEREAQSPYAPTTDHSAYLPKGAQDVAPELTKAPEPSEYATQPAEAEPVAQRPSEPASPRPVETPRAAAQSAPPAGSPKRVQGKKAKCGFSFGKTFLAALLAVVVGSVATFVIGLIIFSGISAALTPAAKGIPAEAILKIDLAESLIDAPSNDPLSTIDFATMQPLSQVTIYDALRALEAAREDERIKGIYLNLNGGGTASLALLEELRAAIESFKAAGKWVVSYNDYYTQGAYYLASVADKIYLQPEGSFEWMGLAMNTMFYKGLIDKLGVEMDILRPTVCKYKSAVEPYILTSMSEANRQQMQELADNMWSVVTEAVSASRGISVEQLNDLANNLAVTLPQDAVKYKLVDDVLYADQMEELFTTQYGIDDPEFVTLGEYITGLTVDTKRLSAPKVAIVYANGQVMDGSGSDDNIYGYTLAATLRDVAEDDDIEAVVLRVNSPGGSAQASDIIWREMELLREKKPVIVSMGEYAASGGYYISAPADAIVANRSTLTGSIGVFGMLPSVGKALKDKVGITIDGVTTNRHSDMGNGFRSLNDAEYRSLMRGVDRVYERFTSLVAEGRNLTIERVLEIAEGRVWSGGEAQQIGLVDTCGGLTAALAIAVDKAELGDNYQIVEVRNEQTGLMAILNSLSVNVRQQLTARTELGALYGEYRHLEQILGQKGIYAISPIIKIE